MILRFNILQTILGIGCLICSLVGYGAAYLFFRYVPQFIAGSFHYKLPAAAYAGFSVFVLLILTYSGYRLWKTRGGFYGYHESALYHDLGEDSAGSVVVDFYAHRVTGPAYVLGQLFAAGPLFALRGIGYFRSLIGMEDGLEQRLESVLEQLRRINKWQGFREHSDNQREIMLLARMKKIDFSIAKGDARFRAFPDYGA